MILSETYRFITTLLVLLAVALVGWLAGGTSGATEHAPAVQPGIVDRGPDYPRQDVLDAIKKADARTSVSYR